MNSAGDMARTSAGRQADRQTARQTDGRTDGKIEPTFLRYTGKNYISFVFNHMRRIKAKVTNPIANETIEGLHA